ncbi:hypothetical protein SUGI_0603710 [Cryptomeria japonica]|uniref:disease resistance RPP13-like protein 4 n=1 Tax=Cryptomeria japonica TaxID=3369 RepID=UPI002414C801|nr:disease resistance RPP13-like protein 4 [Cryptomeria japonica]GLJ30504.1 hypothetical protein SUGI_0603710 [Cryptomeria japonica]
MASVIVEIVGGKICEMAIETAVHKVAEEAKLVLNFRKDLLWLNKKLTFIRGFLQDADQQSRHKEAVKKWLESIRDIVMGAEDIFEECAVEPQGPHISVTGFFDAESRRTYFSWWIFRYRMGRKIKDVKERIRSNIEDGKQLNLYRQVLSADEALPSTSQIAAVDLKRSYLLPSDSHPVGIESKVDDILNLLNNPAFPVIAVVGMGGMGKTYLLQNVYNKAKERYEKCIWLSVSQSYSISMLQKDLVFQLDRDLSEQIKNSGISDQALAQLIREKLQERRSCLVVLDDVWRAVREEDFFTKLGLPSGNVNSQCKIVVTTRSKVVSTNLNAHMYEMKLMSDEESWRLFCVYAFGGFEENIEPQQQLLKEVGRKIVKQCGNLPLAVKTIAASLANKILDKWELKLRQLEQVIISVGDNDDNIMGILKLSYDSLPARLKACFAYLSLFPEDEQIDPEYLVNLWIGEGFIPAGENQLDVAWDSLHQLVNLCLLEMSEDSDLNFLYSHYDLTKHCKIHDLLLDLAIHISKENKCALSVEEASTNTSDGDGTAWCRVLLAKKDVDDNAISETHPLCLRTFSLSQNMEITSIPEKLFMAMRGLRVLDLSFTNISTLPASVGKMKLLKVLNFRQTPIEEVPKCVRHLKSLLFLALNDSCTTLPAWISELRYLQHLECERVRRIPKGISKLGSLRTLRTWPLQLSNSIQEGEELMRLEDLGNMTKLQELWLVIQNEMELKTMGILANLVKMRRLVVESRILEVGSEIDLPHIPENMRAMKHLESLRLEKFAVPSWTCDLANLRELQLLECECSDYPELQRLPNLVLLFLWRNGRCRELPKAFGKSGGFPRLRFFKIQYFDELEEFPELEEGAMACLEKLVIARCYKVERSRIEVQIKAHNPYINIHFV